MKSVRAGVSRVTITPPVGMYLTGMERTEGSHGLHDDLYATALAFSDGTTEAVIITCDLLMIHHELVARVRHNAFQRTGIPGEHIMFCASHNHSGPPTCAFRDSLPQVRAYVDRLALLLSSVIEMAHNRTAPASFGFDSGESRIGINRRLTRPDGTTVIAANPNGAVDPQVSVLRVDSADGRPLAVMVNYACHAVVLGNGSNVISADWPGAMRHVVEQATGAKCLFVQGACADVNPLPGVPLDSLTAVTQLGTQIGDEAISVWAGIQPEPVNGVAACSERLSLPLLPTEDLEGKLPDFVELEGFFDGLSWEELQAWHRVRSPWKAEVVGEGNGRRAVMEIQAIRVGDMAVVSFAGEIFARTGFALKAQSPLANTMIASYSNGNVGYLPPPEEYARGGYEVTETHIFYQLPAPVAPEAAGLIEETAVGLLKDLACKRVK